jgi:hypothetical protein
VKNPGTWLVHVLASAKTGERLMRKTIPPADLVQNEGDETGGNSHEELIAGSETGARRDGQSIGMDLGLPMMPSVGRLAQS